MTADQLIVIVNLTALVSIMLSMGLQTKLDAVVASVRQIRLVVLCVIANYVLVPLVALGLLWVFQADPFVSIGFIILAVCPAAPVGPPLTVIAKGNLSLAVGMMIVLAALSSFLSPTLLSLLLARVAPQNDLQVDYLAIGRTLLIAQLLPLALGLAFHKWAPKLTGRITRPVGLFANVMMMVLIVAIIYAQYETLAAIRSKGWIGMAAILAASLAIGWWCGGRNQTNRKATAITTAPRNAAVGLAIATGNFANTPAVTAVVAYGLVSMLGTMAFALILRKSIGNEIPPN
ncbi:MAG: bile acid:sodium symporter family protein [Gemmataceae bacterium]